MIVLMFIPNPIEKNRQSHGGVVRTTSMSTKSPNKSTKLKNYSTVVYQNRLIIYSRQTL